MIWKFRIQGMHAVRAKVDFQKYLQMVAGSERGERYITQIYQHDELSCGFFLCILHRILPCVYARVGLWKRNY